MYFHISILILEVFVEVSSPEVGGAYRNMSKDVKAQQV